MDTDSMENVTVKMTAEISVEPGASFHTTKLVAVDRRETGRMTLDQASNLMSDMCSGVMRRCGAKMTERRIEDQRRLTVDNGE